MIRVVHFINQFFAGLGGEAAANYPVEVRNGPVGPGIAMKRADEGAIEVVGTIVCGDNYFNENTTAAKASIVDALQSLKPDVLVAGPAFNAGRYGLACAEVCRVANELDVPALAGMFSDNPGVLGDRSGFYIVATSDSPNDMSSDLDGMVRLAVKLARGENPGPASSEGYVPRGIRQPGLRSETGARRAYSMLLQKVRSEPFITEMAMLVPEQIKPAEPITDTSLSTIALITTGGLVPRGNPDRLVRAGAKNWFRYTIKDLKSLSSDQWESIHAGFYTAIVNGDPNYALPLGTARDLESEGAVGKIHNWMLSTTGVGTTLSDSRRIGQEMAHELRGAAVDACCLVAT